MLLTNLLFEAKPPTQASKTDIIQQIADLFYNRKLSQAMELAKQHGLRYSGEGVYKIVYSLGPNKVLKIGKKTTGTDDLKQEIRHYECAPEWFPKILDSGPNWNIVERVKNIYKNNKNITKDVFNWFGFNFEPPVVDIFTDVYPIKFIDFISVLKFVDQYSLNRSHPISDREKLTLKHLFSSPRFVEFLKAVGKCKIRISDLHLNNYGINNAGHFVIIDSEWGNPSYDFEDDKFYNIPD